MEVIFFGQLTDITHTSKLQINDVPDTDSLLQKLYEKYPGLSDQKFSIAVQNKNITANTLLNFDHTIALMPPFSGG